MGQITHHELNSIPQILDQNSNRAIAEVLAATKIAQFNPRDIGRASENMRFITSRKSFAEMAEYSYPRGGTNIIGPSIRLAEELCKCYGNIQYGINEISKNDLETIYEVFCWDIENNVRVSRRFSQDHIRYKNDKKNKGKKIREVLTDSRDVYEIVANHAARRLRAVILEVLPAWYVEEAREACRQTLAKDKTPVKDKIQKIIEMFADCDVTEEMLVNKIGKPLNEMLAKDATNLKLIYNSISTGMANIYDHFPVEKNNEETDESIEGNLTKVKD